MVRLLPMESKHKIQNPLLARRVHSPNSSNHLSEIDIEKRDGHKGPAQNEGSSRPLKPLARLVPSHPTKLTVKEGPCCAFCFGSHARLFVHIYIEKVGEHFILPHRIHCSTINDSPEFIAQVVCSLSSISPPPPPYSPVPAIPLSLLQPLDHFSHSPAPAKLPSPANNFA